MHAHLKKPGLRALLSTTALRSQHFGKQSFVIRLENTVGGPNGKLVPLSRLIKRERDLALMVNDGMSNPEIAEASGRSFNTVKSALHAVIKKLEMPGRARLIVLLRLAASHDHANG